jgi:cold shock CspA family protein
MMEAKGTITRLLKGFGFIKLDSGDSVFFHFSVNKNIKFEKGMKVSITYEEGEKGYIAKTLVIFEKTEESTISTIEDKPALYNSKETINNISKLWRLEAKLEDSKYFYNLPESDKILDGRKIFVIGRKGSGKSAICEHIINKSEYNLFSKKLSFKNFPFNELYSLENKKSYTEPNQYITLWKYLIYSTICQLMV